MIAKAVVHSHEVVNYEDPVADLLTPYYVEGDKVALPKEGSHKALIISFSLKPSCYATMFLREVMREGRELNRGAEDKAEEGEESGKEEEKGKEGEQLPK